MNIGAYFEIPVADLDRATKFYSSKPSVSGTLIYLATADLDETIQNVVQLNGEILFPKTEVPGYGWVAEFKDCEGNRVALFQRV